jgi:hypothetical protein
MFKKYALVKILSAALLVTGMVACEKGINDDIETPAPEIKITTPVSAIGKYFITSSPNTSFKIPIGFTTVSDKDRTVTISYSSKTAVRGTHYNAPQTIVIPAGKVADSITVAGVFSAYPTGRRDTLTVSVSSPDAGRAFTDNTYQVVMQKYCDVNLTALQGDYKDTRETNSSGGSPYGPYTMSVRDLKSTSATTAEGYFVNLWDSGLDDIKFTIDWTDPANFKVTVPRQFIGIDYAAGQPMEVRTNATGVSTFSSCDQSFNLSLDFLVFNYPTAGSTASYSSNYKINMRR